jgi:UDP-hydrolysing UDP-N-acetyl-D-glucosamine 2-epimerase
MKIAFLSGTRAEYGLMRPVLMALKSDPFFDLAVYATGMHLMESFGCTVETIRQDGLDPRVISVTYESDSRHAMSTFLGKLIVDFSECVRLNRPDLILVVGDRAEPLAAAAAGSYLGIAVAHLHGGEVSSTVDEVTRHAITKLSHLHFPATEKSAERIRKMGEEAVRIHVVGAPGVEAALSYPVFAKADLFERLGLDSAQPTILVAQHPAGGTAEECASQIRVTLHALKTFSAQIVVIYPNADAGGRAMIREIERASGIRIYKSLDHPTFLSLCRCADLLVGNSSSGIIEAPTFGLPVVNIGNRQQGRERGANVIDAAHDLDSIRSAVGTAFEPGFRELCTKAPNPYGQGSTSSQIISVLKTLQIDETFLQKRLAY